MSALETFTLPALETQEGLLLASEVTPASRAAEIVQQAQAEAVQIRAQAAMKGREEGYADGLAQASGELSPALAMLTTATTELETYEAVLAERAERRAVELALALADKVLATALDVRPELVVELVQGVLRTAGRHDRLILEVNPEDFDVITSAAEELPALGRAELVAERRVPRGGCIVQTEEGEVDGCISVQMERAAGALRAALAPDIDG